MFTAHSHAIRLYIVMIIAMGAAAAAPPLQAAPPIPPGQIEAQAISAGQGATTPRRATVRLSSAPPRLTDKQRQLLEAAQDRSNRPGRPLLPAPASAKPVPQISMPETPAGSPARSAGQPHLADQSPTDFAFFRGVDVRDTADIPSPSSVGEPSADARDDAIFMTGNWYAAFSTDRGQFFQYVDPFNAFPSDDGGFCCDQVVIYDASRDLMFWLLQYRNDGSDNRQRLAVIRGADLVPGMTNLDWYYYDFSPAIFGIAGDRELDYPKMSLSNNFLYINTNAFDISDDQFTNYAAWRIPLDELAAGGTVNFNFFTGSDVGSLMPTDGATGTMYWGAHISLGQVRIYRWDETSGTIFWDDVDVAKWGGATHHCRTPDGHDPCAFGDGRMLGGWVSGGVIGFMWNSSQHDNYPFPYVDVARFRQSDRSLLDQPLLWNRSYAWLYPAVAVNSRGHIAGPVFVAGGDLYPQLQIFIADDVNPAPAPWENYYVAASTDGPNRNRWGDYGAARRHEQYPNTWTGAGFTLQGGSGDASMRPQWVWFGRRRDAPPSPPLADDIRNAQPIIPRRPSGLTADHAALGAISLDTTQATVAVDDPITACGAPNSRQSHSVWFRVIPEITGHYTISTASSNYDTVVSLWTGTRGALANHGCDDNSGGAGASSLIRELRQGQAYYMEAMQHGAGPGGQLVLSVALNPRVFDGLQALYTFDEGAGATINDISGIGAPMNLRIGDTTATRWIPGGLAITSTAALASDGPATKLIDAARATNELTIEAWVRPAPNPPSGLGRIVTLANDSLTRDFTLAQEREDGGQSVRYQARLRTTTTTTSGEPSMETPEQPLTPDLVHVVYTRDALGMARIYINGAEQAQRTTSGDLSVWDASYHLALANELSGDRPWLGEYQLVALYSRALSPAEVAQNFGAGPSGESTPPAPVGLQALYTFEEGSGDMVRDVSGSSSPADLHVGDIAAAQWVPGGLAINAPTILTSTVTITRVVDALKASNELTIEAWVRPAGAERGSIVTLAQDTRHRDVTLYHRRTGNQPVDRYRADLRAHSGSDDNTTSLETPAQGEQAALSHIVYTRDALGIARLYVDGVEQAHKTIAGDSSAWGDDHLALANELSGKRPWLGEYQLVALYNRALGPAEVVQQFAAGADARN